MMDTAKQPDCAAVCRSYVKSINEDRFDDLAECISWRPITYNGHLEPKEDFLARMKFLRQTSDVHFDIDLLVVGSPDASKPGSARTLRPSAAVRVIVTLAPGEEVAEGLGLNMGPRAAKTRVRYAAHAILYFVVGEKGDPRPKIIEIVDLMDLDAARSQVPRDDDNEEALPDCARSAAFKIPSRQADTGGGPGSEGRLDMGQKLRELAACVNQGTFLERSADFLADTVTRIGQTVSRDEFKGMFVEGMKALGGRQSFKFVIKDLIVDYEKWRVAASIELNVVLAAPFRGIEPNGKPGRFSEVVFYQFDEDGRISAIETIQDMDELRRSMEE